MADARASAGAGDGDKDKKSIRGRKVLTTTSGKKVVQIPTKDGGFKAVLVRPVGNEQSTSRVSVDNGKIVQRKVVVGSDGKRRIVVKKTDLSARNKNKEEDEEDKDEEEEAAEANESKKKVDPMEMAVVKQGYLKRQYGRNRAWIKMWFVLRGHFLLWYKDPITQEVAHQMNLTGLRVAQISEKRAQMKHVFQIFHPMRLNLEEILFMQASEDAEYLEWVDSFEKAMGLAKAKAKANIKKPINDAERIEKMRERQLARQKQAMEERLLKKELSPADLSVITMLTTFISAHAGLGASDLLSADPVIQQQARTMRSLQWKAANSESKEDKFDLDPEKDDVRVVMAFLRLYLQAIDYPLLTYGQYEGFVSSYHKFLALDRVERYQRLIEILPPFNRDCIKRLLEFFCYVSFNSERNGCTLRHLVEAFAPMILRPVKPKDDPTEHDTAQKVVGFLIRRAYLLFPIEDVEEEVGGDQNKRLALRQEVRFTDDIQLPGTGAGQLHKDLALIGTGKTIENVEVYNNQVKEAAEKFGREVGTGGYFLLLNRQIDNLQGQIDRLALAKDEIRKWEDLENDLKDLNEELQDILEAHQELETDVAAEVQNLK